MCTWYIVQSVKWKLFDGDEERDSITQIIMIQHRVQWKLAWAPKGSPWCPASRAALWRPSGLPLYTMLNHYNLSDRISLFVAIKELPFDRLHDTLYVLSPMSKWFWYWFANFFIAFIKTSRPKMQTVLYFQCLLCKHVYQRIYISDMIYYSYSVNLLKAAQ